MRADVATRGPLLEHLAQTLQQFRSGNEVNKKPNKDIAKAIVDCEACGDFGSRDLFNNILMSEEEHVDWLETQLGLIEKTGIENYLQAQMGE